MRMLAVADVEDRLLEAQLAHGTAGAFDAVISCGDLRPGYLDYLATLAKAPLYYVRGNHDTDEAGYGPGAEGPAAFGGAGGAGARGALAALGGVGGTPLDLHVVSIGGVQVAGLSGSLDYREGIVGYSEARMARRCALLAAKVALVGGVDVLVTHAPARGFGDLDDVAHRGFACYNWLLDALRPQVLVHGHVHLNYGLIARERVHPSGCRIVNAFGHTVLEL